MSADDKFKKFNMELTLSNKNLDDKFNNMLDFLYKDYNTLLFNLKIYQAAAVEVKINSTVTREKIGEDYSYYKKLICKIKDYDMLDPTKPLFSINNSYNWYDYDNPTLYDIFISDNNIKRLYPFLNIQTLEPITNNLFYSTEEPDILEFDYDGVMYFFLKNNSKNIYRITCQVYNIHRDVIVY